MGSLHEEETGKQKRVQKFGGKTFWKMVPGKTEGMGE
jgi:hypothetical protein